MSYHMSYVECNFECQKRNYSIMYICREIKRRLKKQSLKKYENVKLIILYLKKEKPDIAKQTKQTNEAKKKKKKKSEEEIYFV